MAIQYLKTAKLKGKRIFLRVDVNEQVDSRGRIVDDFRIRAILPTIQFLLRQQCSVVIAGHLGRPEKPWDKKMSLEPMARHLADLLNYKYVATDGEAPDYPVKHVVFFKNDIRNKPTRDAIKKVPVKDIIFLENLRFYPGEEANNDAFAKLLAGLAKVYVNDAFSVDHRKAASLVAITKYLPSYAGLLIEQEIKNLDYVLSKAKSPFVLLMGGIKISDKAKTLEHLGRKADTILLGGGLANVLLQAQGIEIGKSKVEDGAKRIAWQLARNFKHKLVLPKDAVVTNAAFAKSSIRVCDIHSIKPSEVILDVGPKTILEFAKHLKAAKTIVWNGPLGKYETKPFHTGTLSLARVIGGVSQKKCFSVVGGGETVDAMRSAYQETFVDHLSTGGGAMLEYLAGDKLPGIEALKK
jgi:phosphoglycerate kinase